MVSVMENKSKTYVPMKVIFAKMSKAQRIERARRRRPRPAPTPGAPKPKWVVRPRVRRKKRT